MRATRGLWAVLAVLIAIGGSVVAAQSGPVPTSLSDLLNGGWGHSKYYQPKKEDVDKARLEQEKDALEKKKEAAEKSGESGKKMAAKGKELYDKYSEYKDLMEDYKHLTPEDGPFDPNYIPPGSPKVPASCVAAGKCGPCFEDAYGKLNAVRVRFEKLRVLYGSTKAWIARALSFGDGASGVSGYAALAWQTERRKIEASVAGLDSSYDKKYSELLDTLQVSMQAIEACEAKFYNNPDWYDRYGYMYYSFMADRYRR